MNKVYSLFFIVLGLFVTGCLKENSQREPIIITSYGLEAEMSFDELIQLADLIVVGQFVEVQPSRWNTPNGNLPDNATLEIVSENKWSIFTDFKFKINNYIKHDTKAPIISIRVFQGEVGQDKMIANGEPSYEVGKEYFLFLFTDDGPTSSVSPGAYYGTSSPYQIINNKAISNKDEWLLEDLIAYIQKVLSEPTQTPTESISLETPPATITPEIIISETEIPISTETITPTP